MQTAPLLNDGTIKDTRANCNRKSYIFFVFVSNTCQFKKHIDIIATSEYNAVVDNNFIARNAKSIDRLATTGDQEDGGM